jgi:hypothetical protein
VATALKIAHIQIQDNHGIKRFSCPLCARFNTAIHPSENLARCFCCNKNFNPIDIVMTARGVSFVEAVKLLAEHLPAYDNPSARPAHKPDTEAETSPNKTLGICRRHKKKNFVPIGDIVPQLLKHDQSDLDAPSNHPPTVLPIDKLVRLERQIETLSNELKNLTTIISKKT